MLLEDRLHQLSVGANKENMYSQWNIIKNETESKLKTVCNYFPHFSKHDGSHSQTIATYIGNLLGEDRINQLSYSDILMMLLSFYKHDIGMALEYEEVYECFHSSNFKDILNKYTDNQASDLHDVAKRLQKFGGVIGSEDYETSIDVYNDVILIIEDLYRSKHAKRSADAIMKDGFLERVLHNRCLRILAEICEVHQKTITDITKLQWKENGFFGDYFHPRFIGAMLCLGDLLDLDTDRFDEIMMKASTPFPQLSKLHLEKHKSVRHFLVDRNVIEISADTDNIEVYRIMRKWLDWMQEACDYIALHWSEIAPDDFGNAPRITKCELLLHGNTKWIPFSNTKYEVSNKRMFELLQGSKIYNNKFVSIREIIQNAVDATIFRFFSEGILSGDDKFVMQQLQTLKWDDYRISGEIKIVDKMHVSIRVRDRGIGISTDDIKKIANVSNVVDSKRKELISKMPMWLRPSGAFGMGLQSIFLLTDQFEIITKTVDESAKKIVFQSAGNSDGYVMVEDYNEAFTQGTEIHFIINGEKLSAMELGCSSYHYKTKELSNSMINRIYNIYENQSTNSIPALPWRKKVTDYIPVILECELPMDGKMHTFVEYKPLFCDEEMRDIVEVRSELIEVKKFIPKLNCYIISSIYLHKSNQKSENNHLFGDITDMQRYYHRETLFYRNTYVCDEVLHNSFYNNEPIMSYMDWQINLFDASSDEVLKMNRNSINENYTGALYKILSNAFELVAIDAIDYLIDKHIDTDYKKIGDTILVLYQFAVQLNHRSEDIYCKYKDTLELIEINNYYLWEKPKEEKTKKFEELRNGKLYFIEDKVICDGDIESILLNDEECFKLKYEGSKHILNHRIKKVFLGRCGNQYLKVIEAIPFECNSPDFLYEIDDIFVLENMIRMIVLNLRVIPAMKGYEILVTPIVSSNQLFNYGAKNEPYYIEMPFADFMLEMSATLHNDGYIQNAIDKYYEQVSESVLFTTNVDYIKDITTGNKSLIQDKYQQLIKKCLELLGDVRYKKFNESILERLDKEKESDFRKRDLIGYNSYIAYKSILSDCCLK